MLKLVNLTHTFPGAYEPLLKQLNLTLQSGDFCMLIGSNGSGKSTLLKTIAGQYSATKGEVWLEGRSLTARERSHVVAFVDQDVNQGTIPEMTLLENMVLSMTRRQHAGFALYRRYEQEVSLKVKALGIGLETMLHKPLSQLSGGQRQMIATLMAVHANPSILLLDEHTSALDPKMQSVLMDYTNQAILAQHMTALMITHKLEDAIKYGNRLLMLYAGQIVLDVAGQEKAALSAHELLNLFHHYEDLQLMEASDHDE